jgi:hypothetical protein
VRDYLLNYPADLVDLAIELFLPVEQLAASRFLEGSDRGLCKTLGTTSEQVAVRNV